jgi:hypothetical protein
MDDQKIHDVAPAGDDTTASDSVTWALADLRERSPEQTDE